MGASKRGYVHCSPRQVSARALSSTNTLKYQEASSGYHLRFLGQPDAVQNASAVAGGDGAGRLERNQGSQGHSEPAKAPSVLREPADAVQDRFRRKVILEKSGICPISDNF